MKTWTWMTLAGVTLVTLATGCAGAEDAPSAASTSNFTNNACTFHASAVSAADDYERLQAYGTTDAGPQIVREILAKSCLELEAMASVLPEAIFPVPEGTRAHDAIEAFLAQPGPEVHELMVSLEGTQHELVVTVHMITKDSANADSADDWSFTFSVPESGYVAESTVKVDVAAP